MVISIFLFHFFFLFTAEAVPLAPPSPYKDGCHPTSCKRGGPSIRFPFRLRDQPQNCGYPGFNLTCNHHNQTVLELPKSVILLVKRIDYLNQMIQVYAEDGCLQKHLQNLTISESPFSLATDPDRSYYYDTLGNYTLFECADEAQSDYDGYQYHTIGCLETKPGFYVKYMDSTYEVTFDLLHCRKTLDLIQVPRGLISVGENNYYFKWSRPPCGRCEALHKGCRSNHTLSDGIECFDIPIKHMGAKEKLMILGLTIGSFILVSILAGLLWVHHLHKKEKDAQRKIEQFLEDYRALKPSRYSYADIKRITFEFKEKLGLNK